MFKSRKRKFTKTVSKPKAQSSSSDEEPSVVKNTEKQARKNPNFQKTAKRRSYIQNSSEEEKEAPDLKYESNIAVTEESTRSAKPVQNIHNAFSNKDRYETRMDEDFEAQNRKYGRIGFQQGTQDYFDTNKEASSIGKLAAALKSGAVSTSTNTLGQPKEFGANKKQTRIAKNTPNHAISHDDNINPETGQKFKGYEEYSRLDQNTQGRMSKRGDADKTYTARMDQDDQLLYKGGKQYTDWNPMQKKDPGTKLIRAVRGPVRAPTFMRVTSRWDYEKATCRDWRECGFCVFGDCCKYIHDRTDLKNGWELEDRWIEMNNIVDSDNDYTVSSADEDGEDLPFKCFICRNSYTEPIETLCKHYFCLKCAMTQFSKTSKCFICNKNTKGVFNPAKRIMARIDRLANDGIDMEEKKKFPGGSDNSGSDANQSEAEVDETEQRVVATDKSGKAFYTAANDVNITKEEEIENEIEIEQALVKEFGEKREDDSDVEEEKEHVIELDEEGNDKEADQPGPSTDSKKTRFSKEKLKALLQEADQRDKKDNFEKNLGRFLPKNIHEEYQGHQTTETLSYLKRFREVTEYEIEQ